MFFIPLVHVNQLNKINMKKLKVAIAIILGVYFVAGCLTSCTRKTYTCPTYSKAYNKNVNNYNPKKR